jgi:hypothetical protein
VCSLEGGALEGMSPRVFSNLRRTHEFKNLLLWKQFSFYFLPSFSFPIKRNIFMGTWEHVKLGELPPQHNSLGFFYSGRSLTIHTHK